MCERASLPAARLGYGRSRHRRSDGERWCPAPQSLCVFIFRKVVTAVDLHLGLLLCFRAVVQAAQNREALMAALQGSPCERLYL